jgi:archaemetzincin
VNALYLIPFGTIDDDVISALEICLWQIYGFNIRRVPALPEPDFAFDRQTQQHSSTLMLRELLKHIPNDAVRVLGITSHDLFIPMLSFVFGHAQVNGKAAVISLARLHQNFYRLPENRELFLHRTMKEAVHELGHTFGLVHCSDTKCAMSLSNTIQQVDRKTEELCTNCSILFEEKMHSFKNTIEAGRR